MHSEWKQKEEDVSCHTCRYVDKAGNRYCGSCVNFTNWEPKENSVVVEREEVTPLVVCDLIKRSTKGTKEYGEPLTTYNKRKALVDLYEELLDAACYLKQHLLEDKHDM
jgi:hypothetical protein